MISLQIEAPTWTEAIQEFRQQLENQHPASVANGVNYQEDCEVGMLELDNAFARAVIGGVDFEGGLSLFWIEGEFEQEIELKQNFRSPNKILRFISSSNSKVVHYFTARQLTYHLTPLAAGVRAGFSDQDTFKLPAEEPILLVLVDLEDEKTLEEVGCLFQDLLPELEKALTSSNQNETGQFFLGNYGLRVGDTAQEMIATDYQHIARQTFIKAKSLEIIADHVHYFRKEQRKDQATVMLKERDVKLVQHAAQILTQRLQNAPNIADLAHEVGLSKTTLKRGFKLIFQMTVRQYLRKKRLYHGRFLIENSDLPINEVAEKVGYTHAGYFAKQFLAQFGIHPSKLKKNKTSRVSRDQI